ncbi:hypothetical protein QN277_015194 [Acacia crassicarpa]|uniref:Homeobox domain-containing protein n=1 Tax=Acacia crassicarpa TaxID=499986 RepID=A0AAE1K068_9FABA|nr:hypothetical protein QN277_015194 [Acacia crassicarpa]
MAFAVSPLVCTKSMPVHCFPSARSKRFIVGSLTLLRRPLSFPVLVYPRGRDLSSAIVAASSRKKKKKQNLPQNHVKVEDEEEDAFELLFKQLEEDLKNDDTPFNDSDNEITEEDLVKLEQELSDAVGEDDEEMFFSASSDTKIDDDDNEEEEEGDDDDDYKGDGRQVNLRSWQLRKLAKVLKTGRRKTSIKSLAAELFLDRAIVLELLREPPPNLLMMSLSLPDEPTAPVVESEAKPSETVLEEIRTDHEELGPESNVPVHVMQRRWSAQKRLKRSHVDTLERIYRRTKRPTNTMISSIVHVTNLPRSRVVKWFEDKRAEDGVSEDRVPYRRSVA